MERTHCIDCGRDGLMKRRVEPAICGTCRDKRESARAAAGNPDTVECRACGAEVDELAVFPGRICLTCYSKTPEANAPLTAEGVAGMFRAAVR